MNTSIDKLYTPVLYFVKKRVHNQEDAEDITQDVFFKLSKSDVDSIADVKSWVYAIARNSIIDYYRKRKLVTEAIDEDLAECSEDDPLFAQDLSTGISHFIDQIPEEYRDIMVLSEIEGVSQKEIAERLGLNYVTVRSKVQRGRKKVKKLVQECCHVEQGSRGSIIGFTPRHGSEPGSDNDIQSCQKTSGCKVK